MSHRPGHGSHTTQLPPGALAIILAVMSVWGRLGSEVRLLVLPEATRLSAATYSAQEREMQKQVSLCIQFTQHAQGQLHLPVLP